MADIGQIQEVPERVRVLLACPACSGDMSFGGGGGTCASCGSRYGVSSGVPVLTPPGIEPADVGTVEPTRAHRAGGALVQRIVTASEDQVYKSPALARLVDDFVARVPGSGPLLNIGAGTTEYGRRVVNLEIAPGPSIDVVGVAEALPFKDGIFEGVVLQAVLEHVRDAEATLTEMARVMAPGAVALVDVPFVYAHHGGPHDYRRYTQIGLRTALEAHGLDVEATGVSAGPASAVSSVLSEFLRLLLQGHDPGNARWKLVGVAAGLVTWPVRRLDRWLDTRAHAHVIASGVWAIARRPGSAPAVMPLPRRPSGLAP